MSGSKGDHIECEIVVVGRQLAFVNHKLQSQLETMKHLIHEYEVSLAAEGSLDCFGIVPVETALPALTMHAPSPRPANIVVSDRKMGDLRAAILPLVQYDMFSWREDKFFGSLGGKPILAYTRTNPPCNHIGFLHVPLAVLGGREVDMPYGLWEDLHRQVVRMDNEEFLKTNHPMLHVFYKSMEVQLCAVTRCRPKMHRKTAAVPKFFG